jgi:ATP-dependent DNA helicase RecG
MPHADTSPLAQPVTRLPGVGPERAAQLARLGIATVGDLLAHRPRRYEDRRQVRPIGALVVGEFAVVRGRIVAQGVKRWQRGAKSLFEFVLEDGTGRLHCRWWNLPFLEAVFAVGNDVVVYGKPVSLRPRTMDHPETEVIEAGEEVSLHSQRIVPVYPLTEGLTQRWLRSLVWRTLTMVGGRIAEPWRAGEAAGTRGRLVAREGSDPAVGVAPEAAADSPVPARFLSRAEAVRQLHFPDELPHAERARERLALDEFVALQIRIQRRRRNLEVNARPLPCAGDNRLIKPFLTRLGFKLTAAQTRVLREIRADLAGAHPMRRLLQGDVGSGKTAVAACAALMTLESGFDVVLMAPTEILAEQHWRNFQRWFEPLGVSVAIRTGSRKSAAETPLLDGRGGQLTVGTHALIEPGFTSDRLGLVIIDEQHKFGVTQREELVRKGPYPHLLVMTATPIPRSLGLTLYGDLDVSVIDELPPGRGRIRTFVRDADRLPKVWEFVRRKLTEGRQAYVVYPRVEETDLKSGLKAVLQEQQRLAAALAPHRVGLLHGRLPAEEKEAIMDRFRANQVQVLVATSVIEVGVDVPNACVMVVENAESFGLAQLHQLRGRIGRGAADAYCVLVAAARTPEARQRLQVLAETTDGFRIAEADLRLRGPGDLVGQVQSGLPDFRFGRLAEDQELIEVAREVARRVLDHGAAAAPA